MNDNQKLGLAILLTIIATPLLVAGVLLLPITLAGRFIILGVAALVAASLALTVR